MIANILIALVAVLHLYFMYLEMIAWDTPAGRKAFSLTPEFAAASKTLAANQGLYNGFLAAGLIWGIYLGDAGFQMKAFFLICVSSPACSAARRSAARSCSCRRCRRSWRSSCWSPGADGRPLAWREPCG